MKNRYPLLKNKALWVSRKGSGHGFHPKFFCVLKEIDHVRLQGDIERVMNLKEDQVIILDLGTNEGGIREGVTVIGQSLPDQESGIVVI